VLFNNLPAVLAAAVQPDMVAEPTKPWGDDVLKLALALDKAVRERAPAGWKGDPAREAQVKNAIFPLLNRNREATLAVFDIIKNQPGY
jgi:type I restriction enzyme R subunit